MTAGDGPEPVIRSAAQPVFEAMVGRAAQLCQAHFSAIARPFTAFFRVRPPATSSWAGHSLTASLFSLRMS
jgi:hypothetical protein